MSSMPPPGGRPPGPPPMPVSWQGFTGLEAVRPLIDRMGPMLDLAYQEAERGSMRNDTAFNESRIRKAREQALREDEYKRGVERESQARIEAERSRGESAYEAAVAPQRAINTASYLNSTTPNLSAAMQTRDAWRQMLPANYYASLLSGAPRY